MFSLLNNMAQFEVGMMYLSGRGESNISEGIEWLEKSANHGYAPAQGGLGLLYFNGEFFEPSASQSIHWYKKAAKQGLPDAQLQLGAFYYAGWGVKKNDMLARMWFDKAAAQGNAKAQYNIGSMYKKGEGAMQSKRAAVDWFYKAGKTYLKEGEKDKALAAIDRIEDTIPGHPFAQKLLDEIYGETVSTPAGDENLFSGKVVKVIDGDTIDVKVGDTVVRVRVLGIDAPERGQPFYKDATSATARMVSGKQVLIKSRGRDRYQRVVAFVIYDDERSLGLELVKQGLAQVYWQYPPNNPKTKQRYLSAQASASLADPPMGIWSLKK